MEWGGPQVGFSLVFQSAKVHFRVHLKMEKSLPNPIALAPSYDIRIMACAGRAGGEGGGGVVGREKKP